MEFLNFVVFSYEGFHNTGCIYIFLHGVVQDIIFTKYFNEMWMCLLCNKDECAAQKRNNNQEQHCNWFVDGQCHDP